MAAPKAAAKAIEKTVERLAAAEGGLAGELDEASLFAEAAFVHACSPGSEASSSSTASTATSSSSAPPPALDGRQDKQPVRAAEGPSRIVWSGLCACPTQDAKVVGLPIPGARVNELGPLLNTLSSRGALLPDLQRSNQISCPSFTLKNSGLA